MGKDISLINLIYVEVVKEKFMLPTAIIIGLVHDLIVKFELIQIRVPQGEKEQIAAHAQKTGESMNRFVKRAISETMARDNEKAK